MSIENENTHKLNNTWTLWSHLPHDTDWSDKSYKRLYTFSTIEELIELTEYLDETLIKNCMLFLMKDNNGWLASIPS